MEKSVGTTHKSGHPAGVVALVGLAFLAMWFVAFLMQIQTNEAFIIGSGAVNVYKPDWAMFLQLPNLVLGNLSASEAAATIFGWGIELVYIGFIIGHELMQDGARKSGVHMSKIFITISLFIVAFNFYMDYQYGSLGGGAWGHIGFAALTSFIVGFFGTIGLHLISMAWVRS